MPITLPPLPHPAYVGGPNHVADHELLRQYVLEVAASHQVDVGDINEGQAGKPGHVVQHTELRAALDKVAKAIGAQIVLPPVPSVGASGHVTDHNTFRQACIDIEQARPFSINGYDESAYDSALDFTWFRFEKNSSYEITVTGAGSALAVMVSGGGGSGSAPSGVSGTGKSGAGGGGGVFLESQALPTIELSSGVYVFQRGRGGLAGYGNMQGDDGDSSTLTGSGVSLTVLGGGGGGGPGDGYHDGKNGMCGGGAGWRIDGGGSIKQLGNPGKGNQPGYDGAKGIEETTTSGRGGHGGGFVSPATLSGPGGGYKPTGPAAFPFSVWVGGDQGLAAGGFSADKTGPAPAPTAPGSGGGYDTWVPGGPQDGKDGCLWLGVKGKVAGAI